jgi:magnesium chelatase family protein
MLVKAFGSAVYGVEAITITIEVNVTEGLHTFIVGLGDSAVKESVQRVESAIKSNGFYMPRTKIIVNLAPAGIKKSGSAFDLPIALGVLAASEQLAHAALLKEYLIIGELALDGSILPVKGVLPMAIRAHREYFKGLIVPRQNAQEAAIAGVLPVYAFDHLRELIAFFKAPARATPFYCQKKEGLLGSLPSTENDFSDVKGQEGVKRALEIAAAGGHNAILIGPPGAGKTMLAKRLPSILPPLSLQEALETTKVYSVAGKLSAEANLINRRPFRSPHHTISAIALVGGSSNPQPGEISLAHNGVLFLDELPEFSRNTLESLRQPVEERKIIINRTRMSVEFPAAFILVASMNPCPCGYYNHPTRECTCPPGAVFKYLHKLSGPLLDRIDLHVEIVPVPYSQLSGRSGGESSSVIRDRVIAARQIQSRRFSSLEFRRRGQSTSRGPTIFCNAHMNSRSLREMCRIDAEGEKILQGAMERLGLSARAHERILKVGRTIADLEGSKTIRAGHLAEAIQYRSLDRDGWAG